VTKNSTRAALLCALLTTAGCAYHWERAPGHENADFEEDTARCYLMSRGMPHASYAFAGGGTGQAGAYAAAGAGLATLAAGIGQAIKEQNDREACMTLAGWRKLEGKQL
jgi:hypothetical protein